METNSTHRVIGIMSGTSLDGVDLAGCSFTQRDDGWKYTIHCGETIPYPEDWSRRLRELEKGSALDFVRTDSEYGHYLGRLAAGFIARHDFRPGFIASHGHTIFHRPDQGYTAQIGLGAAIAAETGLPVVSDFRTTDVALGGQGAPLVPIGDRMLFGSRTACLNLGGFANISFEEEENRIAFDVAPANIVLNHFALCAGMPFDRNGDLARSGSLNEPLLEELNALPFYSTKHPKSLGKEWVLESIFPLMNAEKIPLNDLLHTFCEHIAIQTGRALEKRTEGSILVTGGGAFNTYLMERIGHFAPLRIDIPDRLTVEFKEALIFAFLGLLRWTNRVNCLKTVTGAKKDCTGGSIYIG